MQAKDILEIMRQFHALAIDEFVWEHENGRLELRKGTQTSQPKAARPVSVETEPLPAPIPEEAEEEKQPPGEDDRYVTAPLVGVFYMQAGPGRPPFVQVGDAVQKGQTLCIIEAMKMMNEITAEIDGVIEEVLGENGQMVEFGQNLFKIRAM